MPSQQACFRKNGESKQEKRNEERVLEVGGEWRWSPPPPTLVLLSYEKGALFMLAVHKRFGKIGGCL